MQTINRTPILKYSLLGVNLTPLPLPLHSALCLVFQANMLVVELKSEAVKERHWKQLMRRLRVNWVLSELSLGHLWDIDLLKNEAIIRDVLLVAQGEMALEEFLKQVGEIYTA